MNLNLGFKYMKPVLWNWPGGDINNLMTFKWVLFNDFHSMLL